MRVLALNQFYRPDLSATSQLLTQLCEDLVAGGDEVTVIASRGSYLGGASHVEREMLGGVEVVRPWATSFGKRTLALRACDYLSFWASSVAEAVKQRRPDVILVLTTPPMIAAGAALVSAARRIPVVSWVQDVYPEIAVAFGVLRDHQPMARGLRALAAATHRQARLSVALSDGMARRLQDQGQRKDRLRVIYNWADGRVLFPVEHEENAFRRRHGLEGRFVVMYSGNIGVGHDVATLVDAAAIVEREVSSALFLFVGDGGRLGEARERASGLGNVRFLPYQSGGALAESLSAADVHLASLREGLEGLLVPSKLYGVMAVGRPLLYVGPRACEVSRVIEADDIGATVRPGDARGLAEAVVAAAQQSEVTKEKGRRARVVFQRMYDRPHAVARWRAVLRDAAS